MLGIYLDELQVIAALAPTIPSSANSTLTPFHCLIEDLGKAKHNWGTHTLKFMLTNTPPDQAWSVKADVPEITPQNGYPAGGVALSNVAWSQVGGLARLFADDFQINASGGSFGIFKYPVLYNDTTSGKPLIGYLDYGASVIIAPTFAFKFNFSEINGLIIGTLVP